MSKANKKATCNYYSNSDYKEMAEIAHQKNMCVATSIMKKATIDAFIAGAEWQSKQSIWISVEEQLPEENESIIIMCEHGAIFNGTYCNGVWFCMDGYIHDIYKGNPIYSSMSAIPSLWKPIAWMPIPEFDK